MPDLNSVMSDQSILMNGESGSGKTESTKLLVEHLAQVRENNLAVSVAGKRPSGIAAMILQTNALLLGAAKFRSSVIIFHFSRPQVFGPNKRVEVILNSFESYFAIDDMTGSNSDGFFDRQLQFLFVDSVDVHSLVEKESNLH
ncbi:hypothetical protein BBJ28_00022766 [Nothophytophthora sp. Chile5]|nr:hypothetical protein BBJ28_00022766 [Nothophytophthora sp. Chile5]